MSERSARSRWAEAFASLGSEPRLQIVERLMQGPIRCQEVQAGLGLSQPAVSYHLSKLERAGVLRKERNGTRNCYRIESRLECVLKLCMKEDGSWNTL
ncbi:MAG: metalloregulator ArsR/SmtB family transcription factor [Candidatus Bipolaricaulis sp.]|nr:metalloregulator ArsR/SmtB family transcription factor [Candidatus Bipolaricaulis sp.]MDD5219099.1 metalloregulator ArsR/SmtB family transcription factor [Candidatus Bipolaricaulis sp.]MDD5645856.1 metalloregulator ArsR/SmtB family transcription factor [Candidatus Bipolaricaulis sp.]